MAQEPNVDSLRAAHMALQADLVKAWESTVDDNGTFFFVFGDPAETPCTLPLPLAPFLLRHGSHCQVLGISSNE